MEDHGILKEDRGPKQRARAHAPSRGEKHLLCFLACVLRGEDDEATPQGDVCLSAIAC